MKRGRAKDGINRFGEFKVLNIRMQEGDAVAETRSHMGSSFCQHVRRLVHCDDATAR